DRVDRGHLDTSLAESGGGAARRHDLITRLHESAHERDEIGLVVDTDQRPSHCHRTRLPSRLILPSTNPSTTCGYTWCSSTWIRAWRVAAVSSGSTFTGTWVMIGPWSTCSSTKWTVTPVVVTPWSNAFSTAFAPGNAGSRDGWML